MAIIQQFNLNLIPNSAPVVVHADQYDHGSGRLVIKLFNGDEPYSPTGTAIIQGTKPDGHGFAYTATLSGNTVTADLTEQMTAVSGDVRTQIVVTEASGRTGTFAFRLDIQRSALPDGSDMSESEIAILEEFADAASQSAGDAEAWAVGTRGGDPVGPSDPAYNNSSKWWAEHGGGHGGGVSSFNMRSGSVMPMAGDYTDSQIILASTMHIGGETQTDVQEALIALSQHGGGGLYPYLYIDSEPGSTVTVTTPAGSTITPTASGSGHWECELPSYGVYVIHSLLNGSDATMSLTVDDVKEYHVTDAHYDFTINVTADLGSTVRVQAGSEIYTTTGTGSAVAIVVHQESTQYSIEETLDGYTDSTTVTSAATTGQSTSVSLHVFTATLSLSTNSPELASATISIYLDASGTPTLIGTTKFVSSSASFVVHERGDYTCSCVYAGETYSDTAPVRDETTYPVAIDTGLKLSAWLEAADLDPTDYADFAAVEADEKAVRKLMTIHDAVDYLATAKAGDELMTAVVTSNICAKWINLRDYALDTLYANTDIASAMDTADKYFYGEWVITDDTTTPVTWGPKGNVPIMTSASEPYGNTINAEGHTEGAQWQAFDGNYSTASTSSGSPWDIGYLFMSPVCVKRVRIITRQSYASANVNVLQGSIDGITWVNLDADLSVLAEANTEYVIPVNNSTFYLKYRIYCATSNYNGFRTLQFYGREKKPVLPAMLNNSTPVGSTSASTELSTQAASYPAWKTFSGFREETSAGSYWSSTGSPAWIQQTFPIPLKLNEMYMRNNGYGTGASGIVDAFSVQGLNASTNEWDTLYTGTNTGDSTSNKVSVYTLNAPGKYTAIKINCTSNHGDSFGRINIGRIQFFAFDYSEYEWDSTDPKYMLYDHGVEIQPITTGGTKKDSYITLTANNQTALATVDTTNYVIMGGTVGSHASGSQQLTCGSASSNFNNANRPRSNQLNITNVNGSNSVGFKMTANGTFDIEEIWIGGSV